MPGMQPSERLFPVEGRELLIILKDDEAAQKCGFFFYLSLECGKILRKIKN